MAYKIEVRPRANLEVLEGIVWYESKRDGLGEEFLEEFELFCDTLMANPFICSYLDGSTRQGRLNRFPYCVVYEVEDDVIYIYTVFMSAQDPAKKRTK